MQVSEGGFGPSRELLRKAFDDMSLQKTTMADGGFCPGDRPNRLNQAKLDPHFFHGSEHEIQVVARVGG